MTEKRAVSMLHKTRGIALSYIKYRESSIIAKIYTEAFGIQTYVVNGVRTSKSKTNKIALFQPMTLLDLVVYHKNKADTIHRISEIRNAHPFSTIPFDPYRTTIAMFLTEVLGKVLKEEEGNQSLFEFLQHSILYFELTKERIENYHVQFLLHCAPHLGFGLIDVSDLYQQLRDNQYSQVPTGEELKWLQYLMEQPYGATLAINRVDRHKLLLHVLFFYKLHLENMGEIKSLEVLQEVMN